MYCVLSEGREGDRVKKVKGRDGEVKGGNMGKKEGGERTTLKINRDK